MRVLGLAVLLVVTAVLRAGATDVTACGQVIAGGDTGTLTTDLVCSSPMGAHLGYKTTLNFAGHTIRLQGPQRGVGVLCDGDCTLLGPGEITGVNTDQPPPAAAFAIFAAGKLIVSDLNVHDNDWGIVSGGRAVLLTNVIVSNNVHDGIGLDTGNRLVRGTNVTVNGNGGNGLVGNGRILISQITANGNGGSGVVSSKRLRLTQLSATGNGTAAVYANGGAVRLESSTLTGNGGGMLDLFSARRPRLLSTTCDHSKGTTGLPWGVCAGD